MKSLSSSLYVLTAVVLLAGCGKSSDQAPPATSKPEAVAPARQTSFEEVTSQLDSGGSLYAYLSTDQWLANASTRLVEWRGWLQGLPNMSPEDQQRMNQVFGVLTDVVRKSGVEDMTGVGLSAVQVTPELYRTKLILHHKQDSGDGFLWNIGGGKPHVLTGLNLLSTNTAFAGFGDFDAKLLWQVIQQQASASGIPELAQPVAMWPQLFERQTQMPWDKVLASLGGEVGIVFTMDDSRKIALPMPGQTAEISEPGLMLVVKVSDDLLFEHVKAQLGKTGMAKYSEESGLKKMVMPVPLPLPLEIKITVASGAGYLFIASSPKLVTEAMSIQGGNTLGLRQSEAFAALMKYLPAQGNQFFYVDRRFSEAIQNFQRQSLSAQTMDPAQRKLIEKFVLSQKPGYGVSVGGHTATGWQTVSVGNHDTSVAIVAAPLAGVTAVGAAMLLPALAKAKDRAQSVACVNNMRQINLALRIWADDHGNRYPFMVSKDQGGSLEYCDRNADGYDLNAVRHFQVLSNELNVPKILVCPEDDSKSAASSFDDLQAGNVSYQILTGEKGPAPSSEEMIIHCPIHHHKGFTDGSVHAGKK
jgi:hypothetical protein